VSFLSELKRRNVLRVGAAYIVTAWLVVQVAETLFPVYGLSDAAVRLVVNVLAVGLVPVLVLAWVFEWTPEGLKREDELDVGAPASLQAAKRLDRMILVVLAFALGYFAFDKFVLAPQQRAEEVAEAREAGRSEALVESYGDQSIAVLAFDDMSPDGDQEYLSDGIAEEILNLLAQIPELRVISRSSAFTFKGKDVPIPEIAERLNVAHVLEGSVRKAGDRIRITAQLIEARSDTHIWSETWDRVLDDVFAIQDEIAAAMVEQMKIKLLGEIPTHARIDPDAYFLYLQGKSLRSFVDNPRAAELFQQALAIEPDYIEAWLGLAVANWEMSRAQGSAAEAPSDEYDLLGDQAFENAQRLDPDHPVVLSYSAWISADKGDPVAGARKMERALELHPGNMDAVEAAMAFARTFGRNEVALALGERALAHDPLCVSCYYQYARAALAARRFQEVERAMGRLKALVPNVIGGQITLGTARLLSGDPEGALEIFKERKAADDGWFGPLLVRAWQGEDISADLAALADEIPEKGYAYFLLGELYAVSGDVENAFRWLDSGARISANWAFPADSLFLENLHGDPRWQEMLESIGMAPPQLAEIGFDPKLPESGSR